MVIYSKYNRVHPGGTVNEEKSMAKQSFKDECDINRIMERAGKTGVLRGPLGSGMGRPMFGDFSNTDDYQTSLNRIIEADEAFLQLPAKLRKRFDNQPEKLIAFMEDEENREEALKLGLIREKDAEIGRNKVGEPVVPVPESNPKDAEKTSD